MDYFGKEFRVKVNVPTWDGMTSVVRGKLRKREGFALATLNLDHLVKLAGSANFRDAYAAQDIIVADGNPIVWMSKLARQPVELIPGSDAILPLCQIAANEGVSVALVGSTDDTLAAAKAHLEQEVPGLSVSLCVSPAYGFDPTGDIAQQIFEDLTASGAGMCFVALGAPKQELFAAAGRRSAPEVGFVSIGAGLDFFSGAQERAPKWVRAIAMEWLWRALSNPRRMVPRYAQCLAILPGQVMNALSQRGDKNGTA